MRKEIEDYISEEEDWTKEKEYKTIMARGDKKIARNEKQMLTVRVIFFVAVAVCIGLCIANGVLRREIDQGQAEAKTLSSYAEETETPCDERESQFNDMNRLDNVTVTHYAVCIECCGKTDGITRSGRQAEPYYSIAVDPDIIPLGSTVYVDYNDGVVHECRADDTGGAIKGNHIDVCVETYDEAIQLGVKNATIYY